MITGEDPDARKERDKPAPKSPLPTGWLQRGAMLAGQTGRSAARFVGTRAKAFASPERAGEFVGEFHEQTARQVVELLGQMKGAAMKVGQMASFYEFAAPGDYLSTYREAMTMLQSSAPPMDPEASKQVIEEEFGAPASEVFASFDDDAVASASIGQVHRAVLHSGEEVAVKVQYPGVDKAVKADMKNVSALTKLAVAIAPNIDPSEVAREVKDRVLEELDYRREAANQQRFWRIYAGHPFIVVPRIHGEYCTKRVLTQEFVHGAPFTDAYGAPQAQRNRMGEAIFRFFYGSLLRFRIFSADPHPGNYLLLDSGRIAFLDYGLIREIDVPTLRLLVDLVKSLMKDDPAAGRRALEGLGVLNRRTPEIDVLWRHLQMLNDPVLHNRRYKIDAEIVRQVASAGFDPRTEAFQILRKVGVPGVMVTFNRMSFGVASLLGRLEAAANWHAIVKEMTYEAGAKSELGRQEQEWLQRAHPDVAASPPRGR